MIGGVRRNEQARLANGVRFGALGGFQEEYSLVGLPGLLANMNSELRFGALHGSRGYVRGNEEGCGCGLLDVTVRARLGR